MIPGGFSTPTMFLKYAIKRFPRAAVTYRVWALKPAFHLYSTTLQTCNLTFLNVSGCAWLHTSDRGLKVPEAFRR